MCHPQIIHARDAILATAVKEEPMREYLSNTTLMQRVVLSIIGIIELLLIVRFIIVLFPHTPDVLPNAFYRISNLLVAPFKDIAGHQTYNIDGYTFAHIIDKAALIAIVVYALIGFGMMVFLSRTTKKDV